MINRIYTMNKEFNGPTAPALREEKYSR